MHREKEHGDVRVLLVDRVGAGRAALATLLERISGVALVGAVGEPDDVASALRRTRPDVVVIDDRLLTTQRAALGDDVGMIVVGLDDDPGFAARAERLGASAWVPKDRADSHLPVLLSSWPSLSRPS